MFVNYHARMKGPTSYVEGETKFYLATSGNTLARARTIFGLEQDPMHQPGSSYSPMRCSTSSSSKRVYNFTRQPLTHVEIGGFRSQLQVIRLDQDVVSPYAVPVNPRSVRGPLFTSTTKEVMSIQSDLYQLFLILNELGMNCRGCVVIIEFHRVLGATVEDLRSSLRSLITDDASVEQLERMGVEEIPRGVGVTGYMRDFLSVTLVHESSFGEYENMLELHTGVMVSSRSLELAPAHVLDPSGSIMGSDVLTPHELKGKASVATYCMVYHDYEGPTKFFRDHGVVVTVPWVQDFTRPEGFYKTWHEYNESGKLVQRQLYIVRKEANEKAGIFLSKGEAMAWAPEDEIKEFRNKMTELLSKMSNMVNETITRATREFSQKLDRYFAESLQHMLAEGEQVRSLTKQMQDAARAAEAQRAKQEEEIARLKREVERAKDGRGKINDGLKMAQVIGALIVTVIIPLLRPKKKPA